jgi:hypothetical protein
MPSVVSLAHWQRLGPIVQFKINPLVRGCPKPETDGTIRLDLGAKGHVVAALGARYSLEARTSC